MIKLIEAKHILLYILSIGIIIAILYSFLIYILLILKRYKKGIAILFTQDIGKLFKQLIKDEQRVNKKKFYQFIWKSYIYLIIFLLVVLIVYLLLMLNINEMF